MHPQLLLYCRRAWIIRLLEAGFPRTAMRFYQGYISPIRHSQSQFADNDYIVSQIDIIWRSMLHDESFTELRGSHPANVVERITDYMRLHFFEAVGHANPPGTSSPMWRFAVSLGQGKLRCLFCQNVLTTTKVGQTMRAHLAKCPKVTPIWLPEVRKCGIQPPLKKRPRKNINEDEPIQPDLLLDLEITFKQVAIEAISTLIRLDRGQEMIHYVNKLRKLLVTMADGTCSEEGTAMEAISLIADIVAAHVWEPPSPALQVLSACSYKLQYLIAVRKEPVPAYEPVQHVQNEDITVPDSQQQQQLVLTNAQHHGVVVPLVQDGQESLQTRVQNGDTMVSRSQHEFVQPDLSREQVQSLINIDLGSYSALLAEYCQEFPNFLETPEAGPSEERQDPPANN